MLRLMNFFFQFYVQGYDNKEFIFYYLLHMKKKTKECVNFFEKDPKRIETLFKKVYR